MYLNEAKKILENEYQQKYALAHTEYQKAFMDEKIRHSYQVLGAGNFLLRHEKDFAKFNKEEISYYQAIVLLHDVFRFSEILEKEKGNFIDHGVAGAEFLAQTKLFSKNDVVLSIKHHGHLIERLYEDEAYKKLSEKEKKHVERIAFLVRDADKLANYYLLASHFTDMRSLFFVESNYQNPYDKIVSPNVFRDFMACRCVTKADMKNFADHSLMFISWIFDLNFESSFIFLQRLHIVEKLFCLLGEFFRLEDAQLFEKKINEFIANR